MNYCYKSLPDSMMCELESYCRVNTEENSRFSVDQGTNYNISNYYYVVTTQNGVKEEAYYPAVCSGFMEYIDADAFPKTEEECKAASEASALIPKEYGFSQSVHLRAKATSHSNDLGMYERGTLLEVLGTESGKDFPWYHVRIGIAEGYMSGNYVIYSEDGPTMARNAVLSAGMLKNDTALKQGPGIFAGTVTKLPAGTVVRILAERGNWLHVSLPQNENDWLMQPGEVNGYVKQNALTRGATRLRLEWMDAQE